MVSLATADNVLKSFYLDAIVDSLDYNTNAFLAQIEKTAQNVVGKDVQRVVRYGYNGGVGAGTETGTLPKSRTNNYVKFVAPLKNIYGTIEISDKALRAGNGQEGSLVNLLNEEMDSLVKSASVNFARMLYGDGTGFIGKIVDSNGNNVTLDSVKNVVEGMILDVHNLSGVYLDIPSGRQVLKVDRDTNTITLSGNSIDSAYLSENFKMYAQGSKGNELTGLGAIFGNSSTLYGVTRESNPCLQPYKQTDVGELTELTLQTAIDKIEEYSGGKVNFIVCSWGVKRALAKAMREGNAVLTSMELKGGYNALSFNGIPVVADRFCPEGRMYLLNTNDFKLHQLCDWQWLEGQDGKILRQVESKPVFTATLVKYAELICDRPNGQGMLSGITEA
ncbi:MAG: phage major capsid protein [Clostridia bacterium]|nr:phage major capsid protein [Clostridia bacterium]